MTDKSDVVSAAIHWALARDAGVAFMNEADALYESVIAYINETGTNFPEGNATDARTVYTCGCDGVVATNPWSEDVWAFVDVLAGKCPACGESIKKVNLDRLLDIKEEAQIMAYGAFAHPQTVVMWQERAKDLLVLLKEDEGE